MKYKNIIKEKVDDLFVTYPDIKAMYKLLNSKNQVYIFGGWLRDTLFNSIHKDQKPWKDIDLIVDGKIGTNAKNIAIENNFNGFKIILDSNKMIDFWELDSSYVFTQKLLEPNISNLLNSTVFTINSVVFNLTTSELIYKENCIRDIEDKILRFNYTEYLKDFEEIQIFRIICYNQMNGYSLSSEVKSYAHNYFKVKSPKEFLKSIRQKRREASSKNFEIYLLLFVKEIGSV